MLKFRDTQLFLWEGFFVTWQSSNVADLAALVTRIELQSELRPIVCMEQSRRTPVSCLVLWPLMANYACFSFS